jgi:hypothetical protein
MTDEYEDDDVRFNPIKFVSVKKQNEPVKRVIAIAETAKDAFSIGEAVVDGYCLYHYATGARALIGMP